MVEAMILILSEGASGMTKPAGQVRIIAGQWRGRKLAVPSVPGLRPTPDRVRETLFNWLAPYLPGARCLDLFAGSGALGFEALSRGAAEVVMVDQSVAVVSHLKKMAELLKTDHAVIYQATVPQGLQAPKERFDLVFLDPPYQAGLVRPCCDYLEAHAFLSDSAIIYLEANAAISDNDLPASWRLIKQQQAGAVHYHLAQRGARHA